MRLVGRGLHSAPSARTRHFVSSPTQWTFRLTTVAGTSKGIARAVGTDDSVRSVRGLQEGE